MQEILEELRSQAEDSVVTILLWAWRGRGKRQHLGSPSEMWNEDRPVQYDPEAKRKGSHCRRSHLRQRNTMPLLPSALQSPCGASRWLNSSGS